MAEMNQTPSSERVHIGVFGRRNAGKSSLVNALTGQEISVVSPVAGTTTDPVSKAMEILPIGPVLIIDTPGIDDEGELGEMRVRTTMRILNKCDGALLVVDAARGFSTSDRETLELIKRRGIPVITVFNKSDVASARDAECDVYVSAATGEGVEKLRELMAKRFKASSEEKRIIGDRLSAGDTVVLVTPIDASAPKGRLILPQVQTIRDILDSHAMVYTVQPEELPSALANLKTPPRAVIVDSQVFGKVKDTVPEEIPLCSFSILMAAYKGILAGAVEGVAAIEKLRDGANILVSEGCTHHRQCEDIGTVKIPAMIRRHTGKSDLNFHFTSGGGFPESLDGYDLVIHCGGCMLNEREMRYRGKCAADEGVPFTNYGIALAYMNGILKRSLSFFPELLEKLK